MIDNLTKMRIGRISHAGAEKRKRRSGLTLKAVGVEEDLVEDGMIAVGEEEDQGVEEAVGAVGEGETGLRMATATWRTRRTLPSPKSTDQSLRLALQRSRSLNGEPNPGQLPTRHRLLRLF
mmetsp:Transcript_26333/g.41655  ORF Transcript_26333/g.41655 Transcript_26333/m.41655 type:complete len:121 (+) Transcript_26333:215-577(+)